MNDQNCWIWTGGLDRHGYGRVSIDGKAQFIHRYVFRTLVAEPDPLPIDHLCRTTACCNPEHLEPVTHAVNSQRGIAGIVNKARYSAHRFCPQGHPLFGENLRIQITAKGYENKLCRTCRRDSQRRRQAQEKLKHPERVPNALKTHCKHGHAYTEENTGRDRQHGWRFCLTCRRQQEARRSR